MSETFRYMAQVLAGFPDNSQGIISAENIRDFVISAHNGGGALVSSDTVTIPITSNTPTDITQHVTSPQLYGSTWTFDGNNYAVANYTAAFPSATLPSPLHKATTFKVQMELNKTKAGADPYDFYLIKNGTAISIPIRVRYDSSEAKHVGLEWTVNADISSTDTYGVQVIGVGTNDDLTMSYYSMLIQDTPLWEAP